MSLVSLGGQANPTINPQDATGVASNSTLQGYQNSLQAANPMFSSSRSCQELSGFQTGRSLGRPSQDQGIAAAMQQMVNMVNRMVETFSQIVNRLMNLLQSKETPATTQPAPGEVTPSVGSETPPAGGETTPSGETQPAPGPAPIPTTPEPKPVASKDELRWKPVSKKDENLVIRTPKEFEGKIAKLEILDPNTHRVIGRGTSTEGGKTPQKYFRFKKPGSSFPDGVTVRITLKDGTKHSIKIKETADEYASQMKK